MRTSWYQTIEDRLCPHIPTTANVIATMNLIDISCDAVVARVVYKEARRILPKLLWGVPKLRRYGNRVIFTWTLPNATERKARVDRIWEQVRIYDEKLAKKEIGGATCP